MIFLSLADVVGYGLCGKKDKNLHYEKNINIFYRIDCKRSFISVAAGENIIDNKQYYGEFGSSQSNFGFQAEGGVGVMIPFKKMGTSGINIAANYDYAPYNKNGFTDLNSINVQAGVQFHLR